MVMNDGGPVPERWPPEQRIRLPVTLMMFVAAWCATASAAAPHVHHGRRVPWASRAAGHLRVGMPLAMVERTLRAPYCTIVQGMQQSRNGRPWLLLSGHKAFLFRHHAGYVVDVALAYTPAKFGSILAVTSWRVRSRRPREWFYSTATRSTVPASAALRVGMRPVDALAAADIVGLDIGPLTLRTKVYTVVSLRFPRLDYITISRDEFGELRLISWVEKPQ